MFEFEDDMFFGSLEFYNYRVTKYDIDYFKMMALRNDLPSEYVVESTEGFFKVNKDKCEFRILRKKSYDNYIYKGYPTDEEINFKIMVIYKSAKKVGFNIFLENKYSN